MKKRIMMYFVIVVGIVLLSTVLTGRNISTSSSAGVNRFAISDIDVPRSTVPDSCVYPAVYDIEYNTSYLIRGNYSPLVNISKETAVEAALEFVIGYLPGELATGLRVVEPEEEYWPGSPTLSTDFWPRWGMTLVSDYFEADVYINALSGKVVKFTMSSYDTSIFTFAPIGSTEEAEILTIDFLQSQNYTLLPDAIYDGVTLIDEPNHPWYTITFHQEVDEIPVSFGEVYFKIDATYGLIEGFTYRWIEITEIPAERVLPNEDITDIIQESINETSEITVLSSELHLNRIWFGPDTPEFEMRLVYEVEVASGFNPDLYTIDAISGEILSVEHLIGVSFAIYAPYFGVATMLVVALVSSGVAYKFVKKQQLYTTIT